MNKYKIAFAISLILNILFVCAFFIGKRMYYAHQGYINSHPNGGNDSLVTYTINKYKANAMQTSFFKMLPHNKTDIVFVGTSLTAGFPLQEMFGRADLKNRGIGGNTIPDILARLPEAISGKPRKIFLEMGTNDIGNGVATDTIYQNFIKVVSEIKGGSPETKIYAQSVLPFGKNNTVKVKAYNSRVIGFCKLNDVTYIDLYPHYAAGNGINPELTTDGTHLNGKGYFIWRNAIEQYL